VSCAIALVSARAARGLDEDMPPLLAAFAAAGAHAEIVDWDDRAADWGRFDGALLRSAWDYTERLPQFLGWIERASALTMVLNPPPVLRWSADKHYLLELARAQLPVVPSTFVEPPEDAAAALERFLARERCAELVVKPAVGAGSRDTRRHAASDRDEILSHIRRLLNARRSVLLQPYLETVDHHGETALMFLDGHFSHAIRKGPLLPRGAQATGALFAAEDITTRVPAPEERRVAEQTLASLPFGPLLYARVDLIRDGRDAPCVLELELCEPSLYFAHSAGSAQRYAAAALARLASGDGLSRRSSP
jgi:glutathione synthase/RimK-type ligase-like ATP-grasp enzyme